MGYTKITLDLFRHGATLAGDKFIGTTDVALSDLGYEQMGLALENSSPYQQLLSSPLQRCALFASHYAQQNRQSLHLDERFKEYGFGDWENHDSRDIWQQSPEALSAFWESPKDSPPPNGESMAAFQQRVEAGLADIIHHGQEGSILLFTHGGVIRLILAYFLHIPLSAMFRLQIDHASLSRVVIHRKDGNITPSVSFINQRVNL